MTDMFALPTELLRSHVIVFLLLKDIVNTDTAMLNRSNRRRLHECLKLLSLDSQCTPISNTSALWLQQRMLRPSSIRICWSVTDEVVPALSEIGDRVSAMEFDKDFRPRRCPVLMEHFSTRQANDQLQTMKISGSVDGFKMNSISKLLRLSLSDFSDQLTTKALNRALVLQELVIACTYDAVTGAQLVSAIVRCPALKSLQVEYLVEFTDATADAITRHCPHLESLKLESCDNLSDSGLEIIAQGCSRLRTLVLGACEALSMSGACRGLRRLPALTYLDLGHNPLLDHTLLPALAEHCTRLKSLSVPAWVLAYDGVGGDLRALSGLNSLTAAQTMRRGLSLIYVEAICAAQPKLQRAALYLERDLSVAGAFGVGWTQLRVLRLHRSDYISEPALCELIRRNSHLRELALFRPATADITDALLQSLAAGCSDLTVLCLPDAPLLTDAGVVALAQRCRKLSSLKIPDSILISDASLLALAQHARALTILELHRTKNVSKSAVIALLEGCKKLTSLHVHSDCGISREEADALGCSNLITKVAVRIHSLGGRRRER